MFDIFLEFVNRSIAASWLVLAVIVLRLLLKRAPEWLNPVLWGIVGLRLILPFPIESGLSLIPSAETIPPEIIYAQNPAIYSGIPAVDNLINPIISVSFAPSPGASINPLQIWAAIAAAIWTMGTALMLLYAGISWLRLRRYIKTAVPLGDHIYESENAAAPFMLGLVRPRIYLPFQMTDNDVRNVVTHEQAHIKRHDHWSKPFGFLLLSLYWFNPVMWVSYILLCRDIESACDERVIKKLDTEQRTDYAQALHNCRAPSRMITACPFAFGEAGVKRRVKNIRNGKKPAFWIGAAGLLSCIATAVCFLTNPLEQDLSFLNHKNLISVACQSETLEVCHDIEDTGYKITGESVAQFLDHANWKEKKYNSPLELAPDIIIYFDGSMELRFYESEPKLAMVLCNNQCRYYYMKNTNYNNIAEFIKTSAF